MRHIAARPAALLAPLGVSVAALALLAGCSLFGSSGRVIPPLKASPELRELKARWHLDLGDGKLIPLAPAVADGRVFVARHDGDLAAYDAVSGAQLWRTSTKVNLSGGLGAGDRTLVAGAADGQVLAFDLDGKPRWQVASGSGEISAPPVIADGVVVVRTGDGKLLGLDLGSGERKWTVERQMPALTLYRATSALATRGAAFVGMPGGKLMAIALQTGKVGWEAAVALPRGATELERVSDVTGQPIAGERDVCAATYQGRVACFDVQNGNTRWSRDASSVGGLAGDPGRVYVADEKGAVNAWDREGGLPAWKNEDLAGRRLIGTVAAAGMVVTGDLQGYVHWLERATGKIVARGQTDGSSLNAAPVFLGDGVLVQTRAGGLYAFPMP